VNERENTLRAIRFGDPDHIPMFFHVNPACWHHYDQAALQDIMEEHRLLFPAFRRQPVVRPEYAPEQLRDRRREAVQFLLGEAQRPAQGHGPGGHAFRRQQGQHSTGQRKDQQESSHGTLRCFARRKRRPQAGREVRVVVMPDKVTDNGALTLARGICRKIETDLQYPGQIRVTVIRETRAVEYAK